MSTLITHYPGDESPDDDPTGVRDLLSSLPQPAPMPDYLVERINASLAAESAQRAATSSTAWGTSGTPVTALLAPARRRSGRVVFALAGAAAAIALFAVVGNVLHVNQPATTSAITSGAPDGPAADRQTLTKPEDKALSGSAFSPPVVAPPIVQIRLSGTRYTRADFVTQARRLGSAVMVTDRLAAAESAVAGTVGTTAGLIDCLNAIGATGSQLVRADLALYEGRPAVIIVATSNGKAMAFAVGRQCSRADAAVLQAATPLP